MKANIVLLSIGLLVCSLANGQIKIGDNPQNIDPASVLELESDSRVLVITRINTQQMENIVPNPGALVYNTDTQCIHYFDGVQWANLCDSADLTFTTDPIENDLSTIFITRNDDIINLEVAPNSIRTEQIVNGGVNGVDIQDNSIGPNKLADDAVGRDELSENAVGVDALAVDEFNLGDFANTPGFITGADIVSNDPDNAITDSGGAFYDDGVLEADINTNANAIILKEDAANKSNDVALGNSAVLFPTQNAVKTYVDATVGGSAQTIVSANTPNSIVAGTDGGALFNAVPLQTGIATNATNLTNHIANDDTDDTNELTNLAFDGTTNILTLTRPATIGNQVDLSALAGGGADGVVSNVALNTTDLVFTGANGGFNGTVDLSSLGGGGADGVVSNVALNITDLVFTGANGGFNGSVDLSSLGGTGADGVVTGVALNGTDLEFSGTAPGFIGTVPIGSIDTTLDEAAVDAFVNNNGYLTVELDDDPTNELEIPGGDTNGQVLSSLGGGVYTWATITGGGGIDTNDFITGGNLNIENLELTGTGGAGAIIDLSAFALDTDIVPATIVSTDTPNSIVPGADGGALYDDPDADPSNEIQAFTSIDGSVTITPVGINDFDLSVPAGSDNQNLGAATLAGSDLTINIEDGNPTTADLSALATDLELAAAITASEGLDNDTDDQNEIQAITSTDNSVTIVQTGDDFDLSVPGGGTDNQNLGAATLAGSDLTINIEDGNPTTADLSALATDLELAAAITASEGLDNDTDDQNEIQAITSTDNSVTIVQTGDDFDLSVPGGGTDNQNLGAATLAGSDLTINIEDGNPTTADLSALATDLELAAAITASEGLDNDTDDQNEIQAITSTDNSVTIVQTGDDFDLSVPGGGTDNQNLGAATLAGSDLTINIEDGNPTTADLSALATDLELAAAITASEGLDNDTDDQNEIQAITSTDNSVTIVQTGDDFDLSVPGGGTDNQNLGAATLAGSDLTINIEDGNPTTADLSALATDLELAAAITASEGLDNDTDDQNEIQAITSTDNSVTIVQTGDDFDLSVPGGGTDNQNLGAATLAGSDLTINIEDGNPTTADLSALATDLELAAAITASEGLDNDTDDQNEIQAITSTDNSVTIVQTGDDFDLSVPGGGTTVSVNSPLTGDGSGGSPLGIANNGITSALIAVGAIQGSFGGTSVIIPNTIGQGDIANNAIGPGEIQSDAVSSDEIDDDSITNADINTGAGIEGTKIAPNFGNQNITTSGNLSITGAGTVTVQGNLEHPDYVFEKYFRGYSNIYPNYDFEDLSTIERFVKKNFHLPGLQSAKEIKNQGFWDLGEASRINLEKIEELFLHTIAQEKKIEQLQNEKDSLSQEVQTLRKDIQQIKALLKTNKSKK
ncbi:hypothetical protein [Ulvibacterium sp.]|uniref:hypothetical protein n=1 Tax=Ulvibacterium sp. TaxID=2665914 RepID=UPI003CC68061